MKCSIRTSGGTKSLETQKKAPFWLVMTSVNRNDRKSWGNLAKIQWPFVFSFFFVFNSICAVEGCSCSGQLAVSGWSYFTPCVKGLWFISCGFKGSFSHCWWKAFLLPLLCLLVKCSSLPFVLTLDLINYHKNFKFKFFIDTVDGNERAQITFYLGYLFLYIIIWALLEEPKIQKYSNEI